MDTKNRVLKFRAWVYNNRLEKYAMDYNPLVIDDECLGQWSQVRLNKALANYGTANYETKDKQIFMQSTGLFDKNGKEIFEGDILKTTFLKSTDRISVVENNMYWNLDNNLYGWNIELLDTTEIIGDIYTTPELLTNK